MSKQRRSTIVIAVGIALFMGVTMRALSAADTYLDVQVLDEGTGEALADVGVCLGTGAEINQLGALRTDVSGRVVFKGIPSSALRLTLSKTGYVAQQRDLEPFYKSGVLVLKLAAGWVAGPQCKVSDSDSGVAGDPLLIGNLAAAPVRGKPGNVRIGIQSQGGAEYVRVSEREDFRGAGWQPYTSELDVKLDPAAGERELFVQLMRSTRSNGASIQTLSPVRSVRVILP